MYRCKRCKNSLNFEKNVKYKIVDVKEAFSKYFFYLTVNITCEKCKKEVIKEYVFCFNCLTLSSMEIEIEIERRLKKKLRLI
mgnify:CR=1 FL=1